MPTIFDLNKIISNRNRASLRFDQYSYILNYQAKKIIENLELLDLDFYKILDHGARNGILSKMLLAKYSHSQLTQTDCSFEFLNQLNNSNKIVVCDIEILPFDPQVKFDLITSNLNFHWINDPIIFLKSIKNHLLPNGLFIFSFIAGGSLNKLRNILIEYESNLGLSHQYYISPFIQFDQCCELLKFCGFNEIITDFEDIELEYDSPLSLMKAIKNMGESNALIKSPKYLFSKKLYQQLKFSPSPFFDKIRIVSAVAALSKNSIKVIK